MSIKRSANPNSEEFQFLQSVRAFLKDWRNTDQGSHRVASLLAAIDWDKADETLAFLKIMEKNIEEVVIDKPLTK